MRFYSLVFIQAYIGSGSSFTLPSGRRSHISKVTSINFLDDSNNLEYVLPTTLPPPQQQRPIRRSFLHQLDRFLTDLSFYTSGLHHLRNHTFLTGKVYILFCNVYWYNILSNKNVIYCISSPFLSFVNHMCISHRNYAPVKKEHVAMPVEVVEGQIPKELYGAFLRNGPNPCFEKAVKRYHWFDGHAMLVCISYYVLLQMIYYTLFHLLNLYIYISL